MAALCTEAAMQCIREKVSSPCFVRPPLLRRRIHALRGHRESLVPDPFSLGRWT
jgi:hypothetical protein